MQPGLDKGVLMSHSTISIRKTAVQWAIIGAVCLAFPRILLAGPDDIRLDDLEEVGVFEVQSKVMEVNASLNYLIVAERKIEIKDLQIGGQRYRPLLTDANGKTIALSSFKKGQWVFVRGFELTDGRIAAREVYRLPGRVAKKNSPAYPFFKKVPVLAPVKAK